MQDKCPNIYFEARLGSHISREAAADALHVGESTLKTYEYGMRAPNNAVVAAMTELYAAPWLALQHLKTTAEELQLLSPEISAESLPTAAIQLINRVLSFADHHRDRALLQIAEDGVIDDTERAEFDAIVHDLDGIVAAALQVKCVKNDRPDAGTSRRSSSGLSSENCSITSIAHQPQFASANLFCGEVRTK